MSIKYFQMLTMLFVVFSANLSLSHSAKCEGSFVSINNQDQLNVETVLLDSNKNVRSEWMGQKAYVRFADQYFNGNMLKAFINVSAALSREKLRQLSWKKFYSNTKKFNTLLSFFLNEDGSVHSEFIGQHTGYPLVADWYFRENMHQAFVNASAVLSKSQFKKLGWKQFQGTTGEFRTFLSLILDSNGNPRSEYIGQTTGYVALADQHFNGDMFRTFTNASATLSKDEFKELGWKAFHGTTKEFKQLLSLILDQDGILRSKYISQELSCVAFANRYFNGDMRKAFINTSAVLPLSQFKKLGWQQFQGTTKEFKQLLSLILDQDGNPRSEYIGQTTGYVAFADQHFDGDMAKAFTNSSALLSRKKFKQLEWKKFHGTTTEFKQLRSLILGENGNPRSEYIGQTTGYVAFADQHFNGDMAKAFKNASSALSKDKFKKLGWQVFFGNTNTFEKLLFLLVDKEGNPRSEYIGPTGYITFSDRYFNGDLSKAFQNASAVLSKQKLKQLEWKKFQGTTDELQELLSYILNAREEVHSKFIGQHTGYVLFSNQYFNGDMAKAFKNASSALSKDKFKKLGWQVFFGNTNTFEKLLLLFLDQDGSLRLEFIGQTTGYIAFADQYWDGDMHKAFSAASSVLSKDTFKKLGWKSFFGTTDQFQDLSKYFQTHQLKDYKGRRGQRKIAQLIFNGNLSQTYRNISSVREYLFEDPDVFVTLRESGWSLSLK